MKTSRIPRVGATVLGATVLSLAFGPTAAFAAPAPGAGTATPSGYSYGFNKVLDTDPAREGLEGVFTHLVTVEGGEQVLVFCVDAPAMYEDDPSAVYTAVTRSASKIPGLDKAADIAINGASRGTVLTGLGSEKNDLNGEYVARQLAIWNYTNPSLNTDVANSKIDARAAELKGAAQDHKERNSSVVLSVSSALSDGKNVITVKVLNGAGAPLADEYVKLSGEGVDVSVQTDGKGVATTSVPASEKVVDVTATWTGVLPAGTVLAPADGAKQEVITAEDAEIKRTGTVKLAALEVEEPVEEEPEAPKPPVEEKPEAPKPPVEEKPEAPKPVEEKPAAEKPAAEAPAPAKAEPKKELPYTGTWLTAPLIAAGAGLLGGGAWMRRRFGSTDSE